MPQDLEKRWIVVLDKVPRGPLTEEEVIALLDEGILRFNDMGFEVAPKGEPSDRANSQWKLLWQFPQFDRRGGEEGEGETPPPPERRHGKEKSRTVPIPAPVEPTSLPPEALDFDPQQLVLNNKRTAQVEVRHDDGATGPVQYSSDDENDRAKLWIGASVGFLLCSVVLFAWLGGAPTPRKRTLRTAIPTAAPAPTDRAPVRRSRTRVGNRAVRPRPRRMPARTPEVMPEPAAPRPVPVQPKPRQDRDLDEDDRDNYEPEADRGEILENLDEEYIEDDAQPRLRRPRRRPDRVPVDDQGGPDGEYDDFPPDSPPQELLEENWDDQDY